MEIITSLTNKTVKHINALKQKKYRDISKEFFIEGYKNVLDTARSCPESVLSVVFDEAAYDKYAAEFERFSAVVVTSAVFSKIADTASSAGIISVNKQKRPESPISNGIILLDRVRDPGNVGTILRTALAAGYDAILNNCADIYSPKTVRSAMSAILKCRIAFDMSPEAIKKLGYEIIVSDMNGENVFEAPRSDKYCIVIGNEAQGVSDEFSAAADRVLSVPQKNIESLNAAVAAGVMMFALQNK